MRAPLSGADCCSSRARHSSTALLLSVGKAAALQPTSLSPPPRPAATPLPTPPPPQDSWVRQFYQQAALPAAGLRVNPLSKRLWSAEVVEELWL